MLQKNIEISSEEVVEKLRRSNEVGAPTPTNMSESRQVVGSGTSGIKNNENISFLDVRREEEYKNGHLKDAILIPLIELSPEKLEQAGIKKDAETIVYCQRGERSETACEMLNEWGYKVRHFTGGLENFTEKEFIVR